MLRNNSFFMVHTSLIVAHSDNLPTIVEFKRSNSKLLTQDGIVKIILNN